MSLFDAQIDTTIGLEGGYSNDPNDDGGETMWGITARVARAFGYAGAMVALPRAQAVAIYTAQYVVDPRFDLLAMIDPALAFHAFDAGANIGPQTVSKMIQRALNVLGYGGLYPSVAVDGALGRISRAAIADLYRRRGDDGKRVLLGMLRAQQSCRYLDIAEANPTQAEYEYGWQAQRALATGT